MPVTRALKNSQLTSGESHVISRTGHQVEKERRKDFLNRRTQRGEAATTSSLW
jgi:hypothetical protein